VVTVLSIVSAVIVVAIGVAYLADSKLDPPAARAYLATLAFLGGTGLVALAVWQEGAIARTRVIVLLILDAAAAILVAANALAIAAAAPYPGRPTDAGLLGAPNALHWTGIAVGAVLYLAALVETTAAVQGERRARKSLSPT
jgi:hypothetical protein